MFGFGKKKKLLDDLPAIDIRRKPVKGFFGRTKWVPASKREQRKIKELLMKKYPDRYYVDDLNEWNSVKSGGSLSWIDEIEMFDAMMND
jgi:hypothetical protein